MDERYRAAVSEVSPQRDQDNNPDNGTPDAEVAALEQVQPDRLLEGEDESTQHLEDALHWVKVYMELLEFKRSILATAEEHVGTMDPDAGAEVQKTDLKALHAETLRFERRLLYWRGRVVALQDQTGQSTG
ncbi:MAG: hypothetical protein ACHQ4F_02465 [Candidatus Dormibacteria bacterium]